MGPSWAKREGLAFNNGYSFTVLSLSVSWQLILGRCSAVILEKNYADSYILSARTTHRKHSYSIAACVSVGVLT
jgi:hypothetical protein